MEALCIKDRKLYALPNDLFVRLTANLYKVCFLKLFFFWDPAIVGHPVNLSYNSISEKFRRTRTIQASNLSVYWRRKRILFTNQSVCK